MTACPDWWLNPELSLARQLELEAARREIPRLHRQDLEARLDSALCHAITFDHLLRQALARVQELELQAITSKPEPQERHRHWAAEPLTALGR